MRNNFLFLFALVQAVGAIFAVLVFFGVNWQKAKERFTGKGQVAMFETSSPRRRGLLILLLFLIAGSITFSALGWYRLEHPKPETIQPKIVAWSGFANGCLAAIDTSPIEQFRSKYRIFLVCRIFDSIVDPFEDTKIAISQPFSITGELVQILILYDSKSPIKEVAQPGTQTLLYMVLLPKDQDGSRIKKLSDVERDGGQLVLPGRPLKEP